MLTSPMTSEQEGTCSVATPNPQ